MEHVKYNIYIQTRTSCAHKIFIPVCMDRMPMQSDGHRCSKVVLILPAEQLIGSLVLLGREGGGIKKYAAVQKLYKLHTYTSYLI